MKPNNDPLEGPVSSQAASVAFDINATVAERSSKYGPYKEQARIEQDIKRAMHQGNWDTLADDQKSCLEMMATKVSRILCGDPDYRDNWHDGQGYFKLVDDRLLAEGK